jgi:hypothetical protein
MARNQMTKESLTSSPTPPDNNNCLLGKELLPPVPPSEEIVIAESTQLESAATSGAQPVMTVDNAQHITIN